MEHNELWNKILSDLSNDLHEDSYNELFLPLEGSQIHKYDNGLIYILVDTEYVKKRISSLYNNKINDLASNYSTQTFRFKFITKSDIQEESDPVRPISVNSYRPGNLNANLTFQNFVVGKSNRFAYSMASKVADQPGIVYNPFYIFGDVGLGKTHLMQAIGNFILDNDVNLKVLYVKADGFVDDFTNIFRHQETSRFNINKNTTTNLNAFTKKYSDIDVLLVDDIQLMAGKTKTQEEFFKLFDFLVSNNKQIVITSDKPASALKDMMSRLTTRFEAGLSVDITTPDLEHRISILRKKLLAFDKESEISDDVFEYICQHFKTNIREMEGALTRLLSYSISINENITLDLAEESLESLIKTKKKSNLLNENNYDRIQSVVSDFYNITVEDLIGKKRLAKFTLARHVAIYIIKNKFDLPYKTIGTLFGNRDHSTIITAYEKIENEQKHDKQLKQSIDAITKKLGF